MKTWDREREFTRTYALWFAGTVLCMSLPLGILLTLDLTPMVAGLAAFGVLTGGFSGGMRRAYKLGMKHGASSESEC